MLFRSVKYTLDGQNVTEDVISGAIPKAMMAGYEEEETEIEDTETKDDENSDIEDEDTGKDGNDADIVETDTPDDMDEAEATETEDDSDDANDEELDKIEEDRKPRSQRKRYMHPFLWDGLWKMAKIPLSRSGKPEISFRTL